MNGLAMTFIQQLISGFNFFVYADLLVAEMLDLEANDAVDLGKEGIVFADAHVGAGVEVRAALPNEDVARQNELAVGAFGPKTLGLAVASVTGAAGTFLMSKKL